LTEIDINMYVNPHHPYWRSRGIGHWIAWKFQLGFDEKKQRAIIPVTVEKKPIALISRYLGPDAVRYKYSKDFDRNDVLFGLDHCRGNGLYIVEGAVDCLKVHQAGFNGIAVLGSSLSANQATLIREYGPEYVVIMTDEDLGGQILANQIARDLADLPLYYTILPDGRKDPGECNTYQIWEAVNKKTSVITGYLQQSSPKYRVAR
jgi:DNA primase